MKKGSARSRQRGESSSSAETSVNRFSRLTKTFRFNRLVFDFKQTPLTGSRQAFSWRGSGAANVGNSKSFTDQKRGTNIQLGIQYDGPSLLDACQPDDAIANNRHE